MAVTETIEFDLDLIDRLIADEEATLEPKHRASIEYRTVAERHVAGGVASSWQSSPPHAIYIDRGEGSHIWDLDGNEYVDYHLGYGAMVIGHAHPKVVEAIEKRARLGTHFAQPTAQLHEIGENVAERFGLPLWRFCNSGTEATLEAVRLMRANTGRDLIVKIEGTYHGHHDSLMFSVGPDPELIGAREHPVTVPQAMGIPQAFADLVRVVPFNDLAEAERAFAENEGRIAGMIVEPAMMNCGVVLPQPGYLQGLLDLCHRHGAYLAFDEVKTGATIAWGGAVEAFGVQPDIVTLAKAFGGGVPCGAIGATEELFGPVLRGDHDIAGTFNGNPLTMAAARATLLEVLTPDAYERLRAIDRALKDGIRPIIDRYRLPAYVTGIGAKGSVTYSAREVREYRDTIGIDERITYLAWLMQQNRGVFKSPWAKMETWTLSVVHSDDDVRRYVENFEAFAAAVSPADKLSAVGERWDTVAAARRSIPRGRRPGRRRGRAPDLPPREPRGGPAVRAVPSRRRRARHRARVPIASRVRGVQPAGGQDGRQRGGGRRGARGSPRPRAVPDGGVVGRRPARPRVRGAAPGPRAGRRHDRGRGSVRRRGTGLDRRDGGGQPGRVPARGPRSGRALRVDGAARRGDGDDRGRTRSSPSWVH